MIPKMIHQTGPSEKQNWHPLWFKCQKSWFDNFTEFEYMFWDDESTNEFVKTEYPTYWELYSEFPIHIMRIDFARLCFMHKFGGIYADLDVFCYQNFHNELEDSVYLLENPMGNDPIENSMMCSVPNHLFWLECMELSKKRCSYVKNKYRHMFENVKYIANNKEHGLKFRPYFVFYITGTNHLSSAYRMTTQKISTLPGILFNNNDMSYHPEYRTKHVHTGLWGKESIEIFHGDETHKTTLRNIPIEEFDFYTDYTHEKYLKENYLDWHKNEIDEHLSTNINYEFK